MANDSAVELMVLACLRETSETIEVLMQPLVDRGLEMLVEEHIRRAYASSMSVTQAAFPVSVNRGKLLEALASVQATKLIEPLKVKIQRRPESATL